MFSASNQRLLLVSVAVTVVVLALLYYENAAADFWQFGLPLEVAGFEIRSAAIFWTVVGCLSVLTALRAVMHHTAEREVDQTRAAPEQPRTTWCDVFWWVVWEVYEKLMDTLTILVAVLRFDVWLILFLVHVGTVAVLHGSQVTAGRRRRETTAYPVVGSLYYASATSRPEPPRPSPRAPEETGGPRRAR